MPACNHPAVISGRTIYTSRVFPPDERPVLKSGVNSPKTGPRIIKGEWAGMPVYTLTLEERATCPRRCERWRSCYGNRMHWAIRFRPGPALESAIARDVAALARIHVQGFAVRLHILGDFYSTAYVDCWRTLLDTHHELRVFGFTRRWGSDDPVAGAVLKLRRDHQDRFRMRLSNAPDAANTTITVETPYQAPEDSILCPAQAKKTAYCGTCALCWETERRIAFVQH
jgi:hypothetical protein